MYEKLFNTLFASIFWFYFFQPWSTLIVELPTFKVAFMALSNYQMHESSFNTFAPDVLNSLQINMFPNALYSPKQAEK